MTYTTKCKSGHQLYLLSARVSFQNTLIMEDGFEMMPVDSEDEIVSCNVPGCFTGELQTIDGEE